MIYLRYPNKVEKITPCKTCSGEGRWTVNPGVHRIRYPDGVEANLYTGTAHICWRCHGTGQTVTYPWTRGRSLPPLVPRR